MAAKSITFDKFDLGIDRRKGASVSDANRLLEMKNAYVTTGLATQKRPGLVRVTTLEPGTVGLFAGLGKLNTFYGQGSVTHADTRFQAHKVAHPDGERAAVDVWFADVFNAFIYAVVEYVDGSVRHHYLDTPAAWKASTTVRLGDYAGSTTPNLLRYRVTAVDGGISAWAASTAQALNSQRRPATANGFRYQCTVAGTTATVEPAWPTENGKTVTDGSVTWTALDTATTAATEPAWPTNSGGQVADGTAITWTAETTAIADLNCPHTKAVIKTASRIFAAGADGSTVRYCAAAKPRDWSATNDAGFLPTGLQFSGDRNANALGLYQSNLAVFARDGTQIWEVQNVDPSTMKLVDRVENVGTSYPRTVRNVSGDLYFLADFGFRSITTLQYTNNLADVDVGSPIDSLVVPDIRQSNAVPKAFFHYGTGQYICVIGSILYVYSVSRTAKIAAWSRYYIPFRVDAFAELNGELYFRNGDDIYRFTADAYDDAGTQFEVLLQLPYMDLKAPGQMKRILGADVVMEGECEFSIAFDVRNPDAYTPPVRIRGNTRPDGVIPVECSGTEFSLIFRNLSSKSFRLDAVTLYFEALGAVT
ncbi:hypothetical protein AVE30378_01019 [Achromobacter veterisilvae]|uniref:Uncharacterized protein n=1 Tax=Achromobacter veterisilvae TaxID=2069367 RepID=A0A446C8U1_9BURK|nr:hypothetical protein [Achromobacter veterisilvae]SSW64317.1 hypothetical protein AVE30378_01019 [Achromobacter veterisilvae]